MDGRRIYALDLAESRTQRATLQLLEALGGEVELVTKDLRPPWSLYVVVPWDLGASQRVDTGLGRVVGTLQATARFARLAVPIRNRFLTFCNVPAISIEGQESLNALGLRVANRLGDFLSACDQSTWKLEAWEVEAIKRPAFVVQLEHILHELRYGRGVEDGREILRQRGARDARVDSLSAEEVGEMLKSLMNQLTHESR